MVVGILIGVLSDCKYSDPNSSHSYYVPWFFKYSAEGSYGSSSRFRV